MSSNRQDEFRSEVVRQVIERGFTVVDVAARIGIPVSAYPVLIATSGVSPNLGVLAE